jgi:hypothetical protein
VGFLEQMRQSADELAHWAAEAGKVGAARLEELAARRRADALLRDLGALTYAERTGRGPPDSEAEVTRLVAAVEAEERRADAAARTAEETARAAQANAPGPPEDGDSPSP